MSRKAKLPEKSTKAVAYARVSSKEQDKEGFSIPAQQKLLQGYAQQGALTIAAEFVDVETAKQSGRANFGEMVRYLKGHPQVGIVLVEKTDRLYRNLKDWVTLDELDIEIHLVKEGVVLSRDSRSSEKFMHGIKGADGEELHRQSFRRDPQGYAGKGRTGDLANASAARIPQHAGAGRKAGH